MYKLRRGKISSLLLVIVLLLGAIIPISPAQVSAAGNVYYVDSVNGNDSYDGTSQTVSGSSGPWKTLTKVNATTFQPGDTIKFKAGCTWSGQLYPLGSGNSTSSIVIDMYGTGNKPIINGPGNKAAVYLKNQSYWEINNLEVTNRYNGNYTNLQADAKGILVYADTTDYSINHVYVKNCDVNNTSHEGIRFHSVNGTFNDIKAENNTIKYTRKTSLVSNAKTRGTGLVWRNNYVEHSGRNGIVPVDCVSPLVEYNVVNGAHELDNSSSDYAVGIWPFNSSNALIQYNEAYNVKYTTDGQGFDADYQCTDTVIQYNYSHDNEGGFVLICCNGGSPNYNTNPVVRYNISQNDKTRLVELSGPGTTGAKIYNNTMYVKSGLNTKAVYNHDWGGYATSAEFSNNIWYMLNGSSAVFDSNSGFTYDYNCFYPITGPSDPHKITADPKLVNPGSGGTGRNTVDGYKLQTGSPLLGSGKLISGNGGKDYWGNSVSSSGNPNIGAYNGAGMATATPTPTPTTTPTPTPTVLMDENFNSGTAGSPPSGWTITTATNATATVTASSPSSSSDKSMKLADSTTSGSVTAVKTYTSQSGKVTAEFKVYNDVTNPWSRFFLQNGSTNAIEIYWNSTGIQYRNSSGTDTTITTWSTNTWYNVKVVADPATDTFDVYVGTTLPTSPTRTGCAFRNSVSATDGVLFGSGNSYTGNMYIDNVKVTK